MSTFHCILGLEPGADEAEVQRAFRKLALSTHPDHDHSEGARARMCALIEAREGVLKDLSRREVVTLAELARVIIEPTLGCENIAFTRALASLINADSASPVYIREGQSG